MRAAKKRKTEDALYDNPDTVLDFLDVEAEGEEDRAPPGLRPSATGHWEDLQLNDERGGQPESLLSDCKSDSEEMEMTDYKDDLPFDRCAFETILTRSKETGDLKKQCFPISAVQCLLWIHSK